MTDATLALLGAVRTRLAGDAALLALLGGEARVYDDTPARAVPPYVTFAHSLERDWSTGSESGSEHILTLHCWSNGRGRREVLSIAAAVRAALHEAGLTLTGHRLIFLRHEHSEVLRPSDGETWRALVRLRAVTEPL